MLMCANSLGRTPSSCLAAVSLPSPLFECKENDGAVRVADRHRNNRNIRFFPAYVAMIKKIKHRQTKTLHSASAQRHSCFLKPLEFLSFSAKAILIFQ